MLAGAQPEGEFRVVDALIDFIEHLCAGGPVVVALEDLQWSDPSTLLALNRLGREIPRLPRCSSPRCARSRAAPSCRAF